MIWIRIRTRILMRIRIGIYPKTSPTFMKPSDEDPTRDLNSNLDPDPTLGYGRDPDPTVTKLQA